MINLRFSILILFIHAVSALSGQSKPLQVGLGELELVIPDISIDEHYFLSIENIADDSVSISLELGDTPMGSRLVFHPQRTIIRSVKQRYETSITVMNEGPHLDLLKWEHYRSPWEILKEVSANTYKANGYSLEQSAMFPQVNIEDVRMAVLRSGGERWYNLIKHVGDIHTYPYDVGISKVEFLVEYEVSGVLKKKYLTFDMPLGC